MGQEITRVASLKKTTQNGKTVRNSGEAFEFPELYEK